MKKNITNIPHYFFLIILSYIFAFLIGEDSTGGAIKDYTNQKELSQAFANKSSILICEYVLLSEILLI